eukprot:TRINITY_DN1014_c0_g2_i1.p4 TRINITY_DN1014_c0_g2~~TRINITY_DN1014_c0_g2_i1.p4  ORF type:complete len:165 (+),score=15.40 TRINITY_DN1014_c0_g2_i1:1578-2072(+)
MGVTTHRKDAWGESVCMIGLRSLRSGAAAMDACVRVVTSGGHVAAAALERSRRNLAHTQSREAHVDVYIGGMMCQVVDHSELSLKSQVVNHSKVSLAPKPKKLSIGERLALHPPYKTLNKEAAPFPLSSRLEKAPAVDPSKKAVISRPTCPALSREGEAREAKR